MPPLEVAPAAPAAPEAAPATPPAAAPEGAAPTPPPRKTFDMVKAARRETAPVETPAATPPPAPGAPPVVKAEIDMTPEELAAATAASKDAREARAKVKELEAPAALVAQAKALAAEGKHLAAVELLGIDLNAAVAEQLGTAGDGDDVAPEVKELRETVAKLKENEAQRATREAAELATRTAAAREHDVAQVVEHVKASATKYPYLSRNPAWVAEAYDGAADAYPAAVKEAGRELTGAEKTKLIEAALAEKEAEHVERAKLYGAPSVALERTGGAPPPRPSARPTTFDASMRGGTGGAVTKPKTKLTFSEAKRARRSAN